MRRRTIGYARPAALAPLLLGALLAGTGLTACSDEPEAASATTVRVLVRDINIREEGVDCAGTGPYLFIHNKAPYRVVDGDGKTLTEGKLPSGTSVRTFQEDLEVARIPTYCEFAIPVTVPERDRYRLVVDDRAPIDLTANNDEGPALVAVVPS
ncbi:hypothetical protein [Micromonospora sp. NBC_01796]|uniref:hypothetical protein n=1 Tax=Micromonospora sp. NBC_01796 TaxID=2975987 RepID=UPI002DD8FF31|nr:hypothetical protein [Micromonospora sp. NBC_01796]WSA86448.1 hypothetical protein OIE47_02155 [Micromonospora sp. NBC_01796]